MEFIFNRPKREIDRVFLHCSASSLPAHDDVSVIREWHLKNGWSDIGYHYYITFDGRIHVGRDIEKTPAAQKGHNVGTIAICLSGNELDDFTDEQYDSLISLCGQINYQIPDVTFHGHCEVSSKACPVFDYQEILDLDEFGRIISGNDFLSKSPVVNPKLVKAQTRFIQVFQELMDIQRRLDHLFQITRELGDLIDELD